MATPGILPGANDSEKLEALCQKTYKEQAVWFLNAFWDDHEGSAERLWQYAIKCAEVDIDRHEEGSGLDEMQAHVFLEKFDEALTVRAMRTKLRETGAIAEKQRPKQVPLTHYLLFRFNVDWHVLVNASQGDNSKEIAEAQRKLDSVQAAFEESQARASESAAALRASAAAERDAAASEEEAKAREAEAVAREEDARREEAPFKAAQEELEAALADVKQQEDEYQGKIDDCNARSEQGGIVSRNKAKQELAVLLAEDPLPLRKAKITLSAAHKRAEKARAPFEAATKEAEAARAAATAAANEASEARAAAAEALKASEEAKAASDAALDEAMACVAEAEAYLQEIKTRPGCAKGALWWLERELHESKKYIPESRGGIRSEKGKGKMEAVAAEYFSNCSKNKSVFTAGAIEKHKFSSFKASLANKASVALCTVTFSDTEYNIIRVTWGKPHYFICSDTDCQWVQGDTDLEFSDMYTYVVSLKEYLNNLQAVAANGVLPKWAELDKYVKASDNYYMNLLKM